MEGKYNATALYKVFIMKKTILLLMVITLVLINSACQKNYYNPDTESTTVSKTDDKNILLSENKTSMGFGETYKISAKLPPEYTDKIIYKSMDEKIATVDENGIVFAKSNGIVTINISTEDGEATVLFEVTVQGMKKMNISGTVPLSANPGERFTVKIDFENCNYSSIKIVVDCGGGKITTDSESISFNSNISQYQVFGKTTLSFVISQTKVINSIRIIGFDNGEVIDSKEFNIARIIPIT